MAAELLGYTEPRLFTPPLHDVDDPRWSLGHKCYAFCRDVLRVEPDPWQRWMMLHALELNEDGTFRFRTILLLVARQNGKSKLVQMMLLWLLFTGRIHLAVGTAQSLSVSKRQWEEACDWASKTPELAALMRGEPRRQNGGEALRTLAGAEYTIAASTADAARGIPGCDLLVMDELRTHTDWAAYGALTKTQMARPAALCLLLSNAGDDTSVVLNTLRETALAGSDPTLFLAEYSGEDGCPLDSVEAARQANPSLGRGRLGIVAIESARALDPAEVYRTEVLCQRVAAINSAVDMAGWKAGLDPGDLRGYRGKLAACVDVSLDGSHVSLYAAADIGEGRVRVEPIAAWRGSDLARESGPDGLAATLDALKPYVLAWFPSGPAAELAGILAGRETLELGGNKATGACMQFAALVGAGRVLHSADPLLDTQLARANKLTVADGWRFGRKAADAGSNVDSCYSVAGACYAALTVTPPPPPRKLVLL